MNFLNRFKGLFKFRSRSRNKTAQSAIPFRLNFLLWIVGLLLLALAIRLFYLQVLNGASYKAEVKRSDTTTQTNNVQRGMIYDATGKVMVGNQATQAITYTKGQNVDSDDLYKIANRLGNYLTVPTSRLTTRNQQDYYLADKQHLKTVIKLAKSTDSSSQYDDAIDYLNRHPHYFKLTKSEKNKAMIYGSMSGAYSLSTTYIKSKNVSAKELAEVSEHLSEMPGVKIGTAWSRNYPSGKDVKSLAGTVSTTGLPSDEVNSLLSQGYSRNDNVGQSYLEKQYQATLAGSKSQTQVTTSGNNVTKTKVTYPGKKGDNLVLTVNAKFQNDVQKILKSNFPAGGNSTGVYAVVMNPYTGAIYAMGGIDRNPSTGKMTDDQIGAINHPITMGSVVKPATIMGGLMEKVITPENNTLTDTPIKVAGTSVKSSWFNKSGSASMALTAPEALEVSSNSYMMQIAMKEGGMNYHSGAQLTLKPSIFTKMRYYYNMFGLGQKTGIDLPGEVSGYKGPSKKKNIGSALDLSYGNYDGYTTIQLAQYMSTIANGGYRMKPYIVKEIRGTKSNGELGNITYTAQPQVQQVIPAPKSYFELVRRGLYLVTHGTNSYTTAKSLSSVKPSISAKTGTAETFYKKQSTETLSFAGYAPSDKPQVVVALAIANASGGENNLTMAKQIFQAYWKDVQSDKTSQ
ncbi:penicillin-binding protein, transpeptidase domain protein [Limosilactobacillus coleohominis 101-4-CHN]|uniref:Penicillin-binding protein, transpeptidase domain protein n=1 Tax=Limosilactobacillus coleohominis 101-4-CHN TaxID=575594 RepID=C7XV08_9LACO|nr:penicillin-binding protein 2 [Limosilactobacillus coleohominis]EEU31119.1 penicillin-binding protein, transpeptidase domain protein [Limosilactobacillus coleohominis 101-4-CHN]